MQNFDTMTFFLEQQRIFEKFRQNSEVKSAELSFGIDRILNMTCSTQLKKRSREDVKTSTKKTRSRRRTSFTEFQLQHLEEAFAHSKYLIGQERVELAKKLGLDAKQVKIWFQNRRIKHRRQKNSDCSSSNSDSDQ